MDNHFFKSMNIRVLVFLYCAFALSTSMLIYSAIMVNSITYRQNLNYNNHLRYHIVISFFRQGTDLLTNAVRRYVVTMEPKYMEEYFREVQKGRHRDHALQQVNKMPIDQTLKDYLTHAMTASKRLMHTEYHAMHLIAPDSYREILHREAGGCPLSAEEHIMSEEQRRKRAEELLWDDSYIQTKTEIYSYLSKGLLKASTEAEALERQLINRLFLMLSLSAVSLISMVLTICGFVFYRRRQHERMMEEQARETARMNEQLKQERDKVIKAEKARSYFFSTVSHDIRTPLNSIIGFSEMLQLGIDDPEEEEKALEAIITSGQTLLELINDVLDLSKLESGKMELHPVPTDIAALVVKVANSFEVATSRSSLTLRTEVGKMPFLKLDPQRIRQILFNLIGNAVKFTARGFVTVRASYENGTFILSVTDTGRGISPENIKKLMSPYVQLQEHDSSTGTGLGLAICKQLSRQMKGSLELESTLGKGSTFTLRIPNVEVFSEKESAACLIHQDTSLAKLPLDETVKGKTILIVDDQKLNLRILQTMLSRLGIRKVLTAGNGKEALNVLNGSDKADLVLTDMSMPVMDGAELVHEIRKTPGFEQIPVYVITADVEMQAEFNRIGFDDILIKPITLDKLRALLVKCTPHRLPDAPGGSSEMKA